LIDRFLLSLSFVPHSCHFVSFNVGLALHCLLCSALPGRSSSQHFQCSAISVLDCSCFPLTLFCFAFLLICLLGSPESKPLGSVPRLNPSHRSLGSPLGSASSGSAPLDRNPRFGSSRLGPPRLGPLGSAPFGLAPFGLVHSAWPPRFQLPSVRFPSARSPSDRHSRIGPLLLGSPRLGNPRPRRRSAAPTPSV